MGLFRKKHEQLPSAPGSYLTDQGDQVVPVDPNDFGEVATPEAEAASVGLYGKYHVARADGRDRPGGDKDDARYFVLDYVHDVAARRALFVYAKKLDSLGIEPELAEDLRRELEDTEELFQERYASRYQ